MEKGGQHQLGDSASKLPNFSRIGLIIKIGRRGEERAQGREAVLALALPAFHALVALLEPPGNGPYGKKCTQMPLRPPL